MQSLSLQTLDSLERSDNKENVMLIDSPVDPVGVTFRF